MKRWILALSVAMVALAAGTASAAVDPDAASRVAACGKLPLSQRGICKHEALGVAQRLPDADRAVPMAQLSACEQLPRSDRVACRQEQLFENQAPTASREPPSVAQERALRAEDTRYQAAIAQCKRLPLSRWDTCFSQAGNDEALRRG